MAEPVLFRVHFDDGERVDVLATNPAEAGAAAKKRHAGIVTKIKLVRERGK